VALFLEMELVGASFSIAGRFTAFFVRRVITDVQIRSVTSQELKSIISMSCRKFLCKMIKQVTHGIWKKLGPLLVDSGKRRDISRKPVLSISMRCMIFVIKDTQIYGSKRQWSAMNPVPCLFPDLGNQTRSLGKVFYSGQDLFLNVPCSV